MMERLGAEVSALLPFEVLRRLVDGCVRVKEWMSVGLLVAMTKSVSSFMAPTLVSTMLADDRIDLVGVCARCMSDVSARDLVDLIRYCAVKIEKNDTDKQAIDALDSVLSYAVDRGTLLAELRTLDTVHAKTLMSHLFVHINRHDRIELATHVFSMAKLLEWVSILLDSHYQDWARLNEFMVPKLNVLRNMATANELTAQTKI
eukprot:gene8923-10455_t